MVKAPTTTVDILGSLASFPNYDKTTHIGTRFHSKETQLSAFLDDDTKIKDLATLVSHRGVVFFTDQDITVSQQKKLATRLGRLSGNPETSGLHIHPISEDVPELGKDVSVISSAESVTLLALQIILSPVTSTEGLHELDSTEALEQALAGTLISPSNESLPIMRYVYSASSHG